MRCGGGGQVQCVDHPSCDMCYSYTKHTIGATGKPNAELLRELISMSHDRGDPRIVCFLRNLIVQTSKLYESRTAPIKNLPQKRLF